MYSIVLADDHDLFRMGLKAVLKNESSFSITGEASNGTELLEILETTPCDLVILDLSMPVMDGVTILDNMSERFPEVKRLVLSMHVDKQTIRKVLKKGVDGYINKEGAAMSIIDAVRTVKSGKKYFSSDINELILSNYDEIFSIQPTIDDLTKREKEIARFIVSGLTNKEIASSVNISINTVQFHRSNIMKKLHLKNTADLVKYALEHEL